MRNQDAFVANVWSIHAQTIAIPKKMISIDGIPKTVSAIKKIAKGSLAHKEEFKNCLTAGIAIKNATAKRVENSTEE
jgi:hypothetical protein